MIRDYSVYKLTKGEAYMFYSVGYIFVFAVAYLFYHSIGISAICGILIHFAVPYAEKYKVNKRRDALNIQFKDMLYSLSASVTSGRQMAEALVEAEANLAVMYKETEPIMVELKHMKRSIIENRESDKLLLKDFAFRSKNEDINDFVQIYITSRSMGGDLNRIIVKASDILTDKITIEKEIKVLIAQKKTEGRIISLMPIAMLFLLNIFSYSYVSPLYETISGRMIMTGALLLTVYSIYLMEKISNIKI